MMKVCASDNGSCKFEEFQAFLKTNSLEGDFKDLYNNYCRTPEIRQSKTVFLRILFILVLIAIAIMCYFIYQSLKNLWNE